MREAVIVSTARIPIGKAYKGAHNNTNAPQLGGFAIKNAIAKTGIDPEEVDDVIMGCAMQQGTTGGNLVRLSALSGGFIDSVSGMSIDSQYSSGMMAIASTAKQIIVDGMDTVIGGGLKSISLVQNKTMNTYRMIDNELVKKHKNIYMPMLQTAEVVSNRYNISREAQDEYSFNSQMRTARAQESGKFDDEIVSTNTEMAIHNKEKGSKIYCFNYVYCRKNASCRSFSNNIK